MITSIKLKDEDASPVLTYGTMARRVELSCGIEGGKGAATLLRLLFCYSKNTEGFGWLDSWLMSI